MRNVSRTILMVPLFVTSVLIAEVVAAAPAHQPKPKNPPVAAATHGKTNACGCYKDAAGACMCGKKGKCGCPGDCEPKTCADKNTRDMEKEIKAETKRAQDAEKKQKTAAGRRPPQKEPKPSEK